MTAKYGCTEQQAQQIEHQEKSFKIIPKALFGQPFQNDTG